MNTLVTMGAHTIRSQTLGVSVGNPLSLETDLNVFNDQAFDTIDYAVYQARTHGLRIFAPLIDNYDYYREQIFGQRGDSNHVVTTWSLTLPDSPYCSVKYADSFAHFF